ncbi:hypothetical protein ABIB62_003020 [Mucilaginibacter sp. UYP25]|uniref:hypothetical protein n=1 Tax=unclassified Mucilaginibacter TaxID=2617802 RepID=UPI00339936D4
MKNILGIVMFFWCINATAQTSAKNHGTRLGPKPYTQKQSLIYIDDGGKLLLLYSWIEFEIKDLSPEAVDMKRTSFILQLDNNDTIGFKANTLYSAAVTTNKGDVLNIACDITKEELRILTEHRILNILVTVNGASKFNSVVVTEENQRDIAKNAAIVLSEQ